MLNKLKPLANRRILAILLLSFSSGLPLALTTGTLQAWYTVAGVSLMGIGVLTLVGQPYVYKFLWAPILDRFVPFFKLGRRRSWIALMQGLLAATLVVMAFLTPSQHPILLATVALTVAFFSATQDIAIDAYRTDVSLPRERGLASAMNTIGYRIAMIVSGAVALILAADIGWQATYLIMAALMVAEIFITRWAPTPESAHKPPATLAKAVIAPWKEFMTRKNAVIILVFIVVYKLCDAFALSLNTTFLIRAVGFSLIDIGTVAKVAGLAAAFIGSFVGGILLPYLGMFRSLMMFGFLQMVSNLSYILFLLISKSLVLMGTVMFVEYFCTSLSTVAFVAFLMGLCDKRFTATQFALFSALAATGRVLVGPMAAAVVDSVGWIDFYILSFLLGIPSLFILWWLRRRVDFAGVKITAAEPIVN